MARATKPRKRWNLTGPFVPPPEPKRYSKTLKFYFDKSDPTSWWAVRYDFESEEFEWMSDADSSWTTVDIGTLINPGNENSKKEPTRAEVLRGLAKLFE